MKIIDLLNKIANGEEVPNAIKFNDIIYKKADVGEDYYNFTISKWFFKDVFDASGVNLEVEILEEKNELHANNIEFNINNDKRDCIITLDENDLGIDKLYLDNCYFYKENGKWYVKQYDFKTFKIEEEKKIPEKLDQTLNLIDMEEKGYYRCIMENIFKINEIIDYLDYLKSKGDE